MFYIPCSKFVDVTTDTSDCATTTTSTSSACKVNITIDYPVNEIKKTLARHIACGVAELSKLRCYGCGIDHPSQLQRDCLLPDGVLIDMHFDEAVEKVNSTALIRDWLTLLFEVDLRQSDVAPEQLDAIKSWLEGLLQSDGEIILNVWYLPLGKMTCKYTCCAERRRNNVNVMLGICFGNDL